jgi:bifunctional non-homologous end joining protein LigD
VPLTPRADWSECLAFARAIAEALSRRDRHFTTRFARAGRDHQILIDYLRNNRTNTSVAAYSSRATADAPVSMPVTWRELARLQTPEQFTVLTVPGRLRRQRRDPWHEYWTTAQTIPRNAIAALDRL